MKHIIKTLLLLLLPSFVFAQNSLYKTVSQTQADSLRKEFNIMKNDTLKMMLCRDLGNYYSEINFDSSIYFGEQVLQLSRKLKTRLWEANAVYIMALCFTRYGNYPKALELYRLGKKIAEDEDCEKNVPHMEYFTLDGKAHHARLIVLANIIHDFGSLYGYTGNDEKDIACKLEAIKIAQSINDQVTLSVAYSNLGYILSLKKNTDSAFTLAKKSIQYAKAAGFELFDGAYFNLLGFIWLQKENSDSAEYYFRIGLQKSFEQNTYTMVGANYFGLGQTFQQRKQNDSSLYYEYKALGIARSTNIPQALLGSYRNLSLFYKNLNMSDSALRYAELSIAIADSLNNAEKENLRKYQSMGFDEQLRLQELEKEKTDIKNKTRTYALLAGLAVLLIVGLILYRNNLHKQKANSVLETTLGNLKSTQSQLIQSEKMASLGELTAGIAHEIQNPLNFVNNFSEVNAELIKEMVEEVDKGNISEVKAIAKDIQDNEEKINHHGKRADAIVKGMLQHSRSSSGTKEQTDINALCDEYLRLAYHGLRAKNNSFNATLKTDFDTSIEKINIIPQDIGRVLLNLINNAFFAVLEKQKTQQGSYEPSVSISTKKLNNKVEIKVTDNGDGVPDSIKEKIFQPFFTTKPTGQGTGLGLSLSYDIITKGHAGSLSVNTNEKKETVFIVILPFN